MRSSFLISVTFLKDISVVFVVFSVVADSLNTVFFVRRESLNKSHSYQKTYTCVHSKLVTRNISFPKIVLPSPPPPPDSFSRITTWNFRWYIKSLLYFFAVAFLIFKMAVAYLNKFIFSSKMKKRVENSGVIVQSDLYHGCVDVTNKVHFIIHISLFTIFL